MTPRIGAQVPQDRDTGRRVRHAGIGAIMGGALGAVMGVVTVANAGIGCATAEPHGCSKTGLAIAFGVGGGLVGGLVGAGIGALIP